MEQWREIEQLVLDRKDEYINLAKEIFEHPELALEEKFSSKVLADYLEQNGFSIKWNLAEMDTSFSATWGNGSPVLGFLAEYDALPNLFQPPTPVHCDSRENGHGCGHHLIGSGCTAAAVALKSYMQKHTLSGTIVVYGCPAEEIMRGKVKMCRAGCFDHLDTAITLHPFQRNRVSEDIFQAMDSVKFRFYGTSSHAAANPEVGRSALDAAELMNIGVNYLREHVPDDVRMHYVYTNGGDKPNIVPDFAEVWYYIRSRSREMVDQVRERVHFVAQGAATMTQTRVEMDIIDGCHSTLLNQTLNQIFYNAMRDIPLPQINDDEISLMQEINKALGIDQNAKMFCSELLPLKGVPEYIAGSTDVSDVSRVVPTVMLNVAASTLQTPLHHWAFTSQSGSSIGHKAMLYAAQCMALGAARLLEQPQLLANIKAEFSQ